MPSLSGSIQPTTSNVSAENIAFLSALSTTTALATKDFLLPTFDLKTPIKDTTFTGTVSGVTASMVKASDNNTVESKLTALNSQVTGLQALTNDLETELETKADKNNITGDMVKIQGQFGGEKTLQMGMNEVWYDLSNSSTTGVLILRASH